MHIVKTSILLAALLAFPDKTKPESKQAPATANNLATSIQQAARLTKQKEYSRILVVVRHLTRGKAQRPDTQLLKSTRATIAKVLKAETINFVFSDAVDKLAASKKSSSAISFRQFRQFETVEDFDIILTADIRKRGKSTSVRLGLMDFRKRLMNKPVALAGPAIAKNGSRKSTSKNGNTTGKSPAIKVAGGNPVVTGAATNINGRRIPALNQRVLQFARSQLGKKVGNGECWTLGNEALRFVRAQTAIGYTFGREVTMKHLMPGDILQFRSVRFQNGNSFVFLGTPDHTAIVESIQGTRVTILHQNADGRFVTRMTIDFKNMTTGKVTAFRPIP